MEPEQEWPINERIDLENLHVQYSPALPTVLKGINCTFPGNKKIGVVGRTGSGKSTLIQALFRVVELSEGQILIDRVDITKIGLQDLRSRWSIIPQDPTLFQGTMRSNLDPLQQHSDQELWEVRQMDGSSFYDTVYSAWKWFEKQDGIRSLQKNSKDPAPEFYNIYLERLKGDADG
ncbi:unnamed protein product [Camellia sinensis]